jgi:transcriptional regulator with XRE-family HTH domain
MRRVRRPCATDQDRRPLRLIWLLMGRRRAVDKNITISVILAEMRGNSRLMDGKALKAARQAKNWTQKDAAHALGVTQAYLSMLETGYRAVSKSLARKALKVLDLPPTALPLQSPTGGPTFSSGYDYGADLAALGYPGFAYLRSKLRKNPAGVLLSALSEPNLDARVAEGLPWLALTYVDMDWDWLVRNVKLSDVQNRLGFAVSLAREVAEGKNDTDRAEKLGGLLQALERARLAREDTFCHDSMTQTERSWLRQHRSRTARHWNLLTDMEGKHLAYAYC